jgi:hypothetical protein
LSILVLSNITESENHPFQLFEKIKIIKELVDNSRCFKNLKETAIVIKELIKKP